MTAVDAAERLEKIRELLDEAIYRDDVAEGVGLSVAGLKTWLYRQHAGELGARLITLPLKKLGPVPTEKTCEACGKTMTRREGESSACWRTRSTCNKYCGAAVSVRRRDPSAWDVKATNRVRLTGKVREGIHFVHQPNSVLVTCSRCRYGFPRSSMRAAQRAKRLHERVDCLGWVA